jgi:predicted nuclease of predicted toxin-antitoxin system
MTSYSFLLDRDAAKTASLFPRKRTRTIAQIGLPENASDREIIRMACEREFIIVTANGDDFVREILAFQKQTKRKACHELRGLVILPNQFEIQKRVLRDLEERLRFGNEHLHWHDVWNRNFCVRVRKTGQPQVWRIPRCFYCLKDELTDK